MCVTYLARPLPEYVSFVFPFVLHRHPIDSGTKTSPIIYRNDDDRISTEGTTMVVWYLPAALYFSKTVNYRRVIDAYLNPLHPSPNFNVHDDAVG